MHSINSTSIPNKTTDFLLGYWVSNSAFTSGIIMENTVFENTFAADTSISDTVLPSPAFVTYSIVNNAISQYDKYTIPYLF